jgi:hypothetical protein
MAAPAAEPVLSYPDTCLSNVMELIPGLDVEGAKHVLDVACFKVVSAYTNRGRRRFWSTVDRQAATFLLLSKASAFARTFGPAVIADLKAWDARRGRLKDLHANALENLGQWIRFALAPYPGGMPEWKEVAQEFHLNASLSMLCALCKLIKYVIEVAPLVLDRVRTVQSQFAELTDDARRSHLSSALDEILEDDEAGTDEKEEAPLLTYLLMDILVDELPFADPAISPDTIAAHLGARREVLKNTIYALRSQQAQQQPSSRKQQ